ncbi:alpha/beta fold hydrolase [Cribrihabitans neustonicus]|uniref:alpha/beta fold hydrolase n=1 Tax=Cribrihabitans neustonicus TaxID=1429085 RepID=UPI003B5B554A
MAVAIQRNNVKTFGTDGPAMVFVHGFGCDQTMWHQLQSRFENSHRTVLLDLTGMGQSDLQAYDFRRHAGIDGHAADLVEVLEELELTGAVLVGHSIGASICAAAALRAPERVSRLVLVSPSPCFLNDPDSGYTGGFEAGQLEELIELLESNQMGWSSQMAPVIAGHPAGTAATDELTQSFCRTDPQIMAHFGKVTFFSDCRGELARLTHPSLIVHCGEDALVPMATADWMRENIPQSTLAVLQRPGHCPHMTVPGEVEEAMRAFLGKR